MWFIHRVSSVRIDKFACFLHPVSRSITSSSFQNFSIGQLKVSVQLANGTSGIITKTIIISHEAPIHVYNFEVSNNHTYYVGISGALVHNTCNTLSSKRHQAVKDAWKREIDAVNNGTSKYNWSTSELQNLLTKGSIPNYEGHHIKTVKELLGTAQENLISSADDIVFLTKSNHVYVHPGGYKNPTDLNRLVELLPWVVERFSSLGILY